MVRKVLRGLNILFLLLVIISTFCSCTNEMNMLDGNNNKQINFSVSVPEWKNTDSLSSSKTSRAMPIKDPSLNTSTKFNLIADQNDGTGGYTTLIDKEVVSFTNSIWQTVSPHYWSGKTNNTINFYAYYPSDISNISHTAGSVPTLSYTVPNDAVNQIDIMTATTNNVTGNTNSSTSLAFSHIFAAVQFSIGSAGMPTGTINGISLNNILYKGVYNFNGTWTPDAMSKTSFPQTVSSSTNANTAIISGTTTFMMMPQTLGSDASVTVTYSNGGTLTKSISGTWTAGNIYTYNISKTIPVANFDYTGNVQTYTIPISGTYKLEVWGAEGGYNTTSLNGGKGGYSFGNIKLNGNKIIYIYVGGSGNVSNGYNGGGLGQAIGGGATHISILSGLLNTMSTNTSNILIVAGGGGGATDGYIGGDGGGIIGSDGVGVHPCASTTGTGGTQTYGGAGGTSTDYGIAASGAFGSGGSGITSNESGPGGGGGWYGGGGTPVGGGAGGGSGHLGSNLISGTTGMSNGVRSGNGYARITFVSAN